jgi:hypothetical protein
VHRSDVAARRARAGSLGCSECEMSALMGERQKSRRNALVLATKFCKVVIQHQLAVVRVPFVAIGLDSKGFESDLLVLPLRAERGAESVQHLVRSEFEVGTLEKRKLDNV